MLCLQDPQDSSALHDLSSPVQVMERPSFQILCGLYILLHSALTALACSVRLKWLRLFSDVGNQRPEGTPSLCCTMWRTVSCRKAGPIQAPCPCQSMMDEIVKGGFSTPVNSLTRRNKLDACKLGCQSMGIT